MFTDQLSNTLQLVRLRASQVSTIFCKKKLNLGGYNIPLIISSVGCVMHFCYCGIVPTANQLDIPFLRMYLWKASVRDKVYNTI